MTDWKEALSRVQQMVDAESEWADIPWADWLTIRAHIEGLEAQYVELVNMYTQQGLNAQNLLRRAEAAERDARLAKALLMKALPYLEDHCDEGPLGEGWKSDDLESLIAAIATTEQAAGGLVREVG